VLGPNGSNVLIAAGHQIEKLPLSEISRPMTGHQPIALAAGSNPPAALAEQRTHMGTVPTGYTWQMDTACLTHADGPL
jgi:hypothetical protein